MQRILDLHGNLSPGHSQASNIFRLWNQSRIDNRSIIFDPDLHVFVPYNYSTSYCAGKGREAGIFSKFTKKKESQICVDCKCMVIRSHEGISLQKLSLHWFRKEFESLVIGFERFQTPHMAEIFATCLEEIVYFWGIRSRLSAVKTGNAGNVVAVMNIWRKRLRIAPERSTNSLHYMRWLANVINLAVKDYLKNVYAEINSILSTIQTIRTFFKRRDLFQRVCTAFGETNIPFPCLDCNNSSPQIMAQFRENV